MMDDLISREAAIEALWKALYAYEAKTERQFIESDELDVGDWIEHRIFVQNMNDSDRQTILELPSTDAVEVVRCKDCYHYDEESEKCILNNSEMKPMDYCSYGSK